MKNDQKWKGVPGADLMEQGLADLAEKRVTEHSLLVMVGAPRLRRLGIELAEVKRVNSGPIEHELYDLLESLYGAAAYSRYNSLLRRMDSFAHALEREQAKSSLETR